MPDPLASDGTVPFGAPMSPPSRRMTVERARKIWGPGHEQFTDRQFMDMIDLFYLLSTGVYERGFRFDNPSAPEQDGEAFTSSP